MYMRNVLFAYAVVPKDPVSNQFTPTGIPTVVLAPIHFDAPVNADLLSDLRRNVPAAVLAQFLGLRAQVSKQTSKGRNNPPLQSPLPSLNAGFKNLEPPPRLVPWPPGADINESIENCYVDAPDSLDYGKQSIVSYEQSWADTTTTVTQVSGLIAQWMGKVGESTQSLTISGAKNNWLSYGTDSKVTLQCPEIAPAYYAREMDVWFDTVMGTLLAIPNGVLVPYGQQPPIQGSCSPNTDVVLKIGGKRYRARSNAQGNFAFRFASIPRGPGSLVAGNEILPINYNGAPLAKLNFKVGSGMVTSSVAGKTLGGANLADAPSQACCPITGVDMANDVVTARVTSTGQSFQFTVKDPALLHGLKVGQSVFANFQTGQVSVNGKDVCCQINSLTSDQRQPVRSATEVPMIQNSTNLPGSTQACCQITVINQQTGVATGVVDATNQVFQFKVNNRALLQSLRIGQPIFANFKNRQVSLDGRQVFGNIVAIGASGQNPVVQTTQGGGVTNNAAVIPGTGGSRQAIGVNPRTLRTETLDPCTIATADQLKYLLNGAIAKYFPIAMQSGGEHIQLSDPKVTQTTCPNFTLILEVHVKYEQTRGLVQFQTGGTMDIQSPLIATIEYQPVSPTDGLRVGNLYRAFVTLSNPQITSLHIDSPYPSWLDTSWIRDCLNGRYSNWGCTDRLHAMSFDVTDLVRTYLSAISKNAPPPSLENRLGGLQLRIGVRN